jgi:hypothetical protein
MVLGGFWQPYSPRSDSEFRSAKCLNCVLLRAFNFKMKIKSFLSLALAGCLSLNVAFAETAEMTGKVVGFNSDNLRVQYGDDVWTIKRGATTKVTGPVRVGETVTVNYNRDDAKKEDPKPTPRPTPAR